MTNPFLFAAISAVLALCMPIMAHAQQSAAQQGAAEEQLAVQAFYQQGAPFQNALPHFLAAAKAGNADACGYLDYMHRVWFVNLPNAPEVRAWCRTAVVARGGPRNQAEADAREQAVATQVLDLLKRVPSLRIDPSADEIHRAESLNTEEIAKIKDIKKSIKECNNNNYQDTFEHQVWETAETVCGNVGYVLERTDVNSTAAEAAYARSCALPTINVKGVFLSGCVSLSELYEERGDLILALAVLQNAPKCQGTLMATADAPAIDPDIIRNFTNSQLHDCLQHESALLQIMHLPEEERLVDSKLCDAADEAGCRSLAALGDQVNMEAVDERQANLNANSASQAEADQAADAQAQAQHDARVNTVIGALSSLPGASNPNGIVDTANHESSQIIAVGAANDAARRQAAAQQHSQANAPQVTQEASVGVASQQGPQQAQPATTLSTTTTNSTAPSSTCTSFPTFVMASSNSIVAATDMGQPGYQVALQYTIPPGYRLDNACAQISNFGTSCNLQGGLIKIEGTPGNQKIWTSVTLDNGTLQQGYVGTVNDNLPTPFTVTLFQNGSGCGPIQASGAGTVN